MRSSLTCPKCTSRKFWILDQLSLLRRVELAITGFEAMVCGRCGFTEIYAADLSRVARVGTFVDGDASG